MHKGKKKRKKKELNTDERESAHETHTYTLGLKTNKQEKQERLTERRREQDIYFYSQITRPEAFFFFLFFLSFLFSRRGGWEERG